MNIPLAAL